MHIHARFCTTFANSTSLANENNYYFQTLQPILLNHAALSLQATRYVTQGSFSGLHPRKILHCFFVSSVCLKATYWVGWNL